MRYKLRHGGGQRARPDTEPADRPAENEGRHGLVQPQRTVGPQPRRSRQPTPGRPTEATAGSVYAARDGTVVGVNVFAQEIRGDRPAVVVEGVCVRSHAGDIARAPEVDPSRDAQ
jgi:hypothetical protein